MAGLYEQVVGKLELNIQSVVLNDWLGGMLRSWQSAAEEKGLAWSSEVPADLPQVQMDADRMAQVLGNLLSNAVKYTKPGGTIHFAVQADEKEIRFSVKDSGVGIQADEQEKVLQPFYRGEQGKRIKQGMGLGADHLG